MTNKSNVTEHKLREILIGLLKNKNLKLSFAESCTGGALASYMTNFEGSSQWVNGGVVVYNNNMKYIILGINVEDEYSFICSEMMARQIAKITQSDIGVGISAKLPSKNEENISDENNNNDSIIGYLSIYLNNEQGRYSTVPLTYNTMKHVSRPVQKIKCIKIMLEELIKIVEVF